MPSIRYLEFKLGHWVKLVDGQIVGPADPAEVAAWKQEQVDQAAIWADVVKRVTPPQSRPEPAATASQQVVRPADPAATPETDGAGSFGAPAPALDLGFEWPPPQPARASSASVPEQMDSAAQTSAQGLGDEEEQPGMPPKLLLSVQDIRAVRRMLGDSAGRLPPPVIDLRPRAKSEPGSDSVRPSEDTPAEEKAVHTESTAPELDAAIIPATEAPVAATPAPDDSAHVAAEAHALPTPVEREHEAVAEPLPWEESARALPSIEKEVLASTQTEATPMEVPLQSMQPEEETPAPTTVAEEGTVAPQVELHEEESEPTAGKTADEAPPPPEETLVEKGTFLPKGEMTLEAEEWESSTQDHDEEETEPAEEQTSAEESPEQPVEDESEFETETEESEGEGEEEPQARRSHMPSRHAGRTAVRPSARGKADHSVPLDRPGPTYRWFLAAPADDFISVVRSALTKYQSKAGQSPGVLLCHPEDLLLLEQAGLAVDVRPGKGVPPRNFWIGPR